MIDLPIMSQKVISIFINWLLVVIYLFLITFIYFIQFCVSQIPFFVSSNILNAAQLLQIHSLWLTATSKAFIVGDRINLEYVWSFPVE